MSTLVNKMLTFCVVMAGGMIPFLEGMRWHGIPLTGIVGAALTGFASVGIQGRVRTEGPTLKGRADDGPK